MKKLAFISDLIFTFFVSFLLTLLLFRHLRVPLAPAITLAAICGGLVTLSVGAYLSSRRKNLFLKKSEAEKKEKLLLHLALSGDERNTDFFIRLLSEQNANVPFKRTGKARITSPGEVYFIRFTFAPVAADELSSFARLKTNRAKILLCSRVDETAKDLCERFDIQIKNGDDIFQAVRAADAFPDSFLGDTPREKRKKFSFQLWFSKSNSRRFLLSGTLVLLLSRLTPFPYYYLAFGSLLVLAAIFTRIFGKQ